MRLPLILLVAAVSTALPLSAQSTLTENTLQLDDQLNPPAGSIQDLSWLVGHWSGDMLGGRAEEVWMPPSAGTMAGMFKLVQDGEVSLYEFMTLVEEGGSIILKLKHFNSDLTGWEEKDNHVSFLLVKLEDNAAYFDGLTFKLVDRDTLQGFLAMHGPDRVSEAAFTYSRVGPSTGSK